MRDAGCGTGVPFHSSYSRRSGPLPILSFVLLFVPSMVALVEQSKENVACWTGYMSTIGINHKRDGAVFDKYLNAVLFKAKNKEVLVMI